MTYRSLCVVLIGLLGCRRESSLVGVPLAQGRGAVLDDGGADAPRTASSSQPTTPAADLSCAPRPFEDPPGTSGLWRFADSAGLFGFKNAAGHVVIAARFLEAYEFSPGGVSAAIEPPGRPVFIDTSGRVLADAFLFDNGPDYFTDGYARIVRAGKFGFIDTKGRITIAPRWDFAGPFCNDRAAVCNGCTRTTLGEHTTWSGGAWGFIDATGREVVPLRYEEVVGFDPGEAETEVVLAGKHMVIDREGHVVHQGGK